MKVSNWAILLAMTCGLSAATAFAQSGLRQPGQVAPVGFEYGSYDYYAAQEPAAPSPSAFMWISASPSDSRSAAPPARLKAASAVEASRWSMTMGAMVAASSSY